MTRQMFLHAYGPHWTSSNEDILYIWRLIAQDDSQRCEELLIHRFRLLRSWPICHHLSHIIVKHRLALLNVKFCSLSFFFCFPILRTRSLLLLPNFIQIILYRLEKIRGLCHASSLHQPKI